MNFNLKTPAQTFSILILAGVTFILFSVALGFDPQPVAIAQEPVGDAPAEEDATPTPGVNPSTATPTQPSSSGVDLMVVQYASATTVTLINPAITYTIYITNVGSTDASGVLLFRDSYPETLFGPQWDFSISHIDKEERGYTKEWFFTEGIPAGGSAVITLTGNIIAQQSCPVVNTVAIETYYSPTAEVNPANNISEMTVGVEALNPCTGPAYLPLIIRQPSPTPTPTPTPTDTPTPTNTPTITPTPEDTPTPTSTPTRTPTPQNQDIIYETDYEDDDWATGRDNSNRCDSYYENDQYWIEAEPDDGGIECWRPAPEDAEFEEGVVEAEMYHSEGESNSGYGLYMNGRGGDNFYLFRIWPNRPECDEGGDWHLYRREDGDTENVGNGDCHASIERGFGRGNANVLKMEHDRDGDISVFVNGTLLGKFEDDDPLGGEGTGLYVRTQDDTDDGRDVLVKTNYFRVYELD